MHSSHLCLTVRTQPIAIAIRLPEQQKRLLKQITHDVLNKCDRVSLLTSKTLAEQSNRPLAKVLLFAFFFAPGKKLFMQEV
ncbi:hypothetical protein [Nostoc sp. WHI]|uniref:hypothetical protein n=1 Tax=Nostoc sp. WHI TaxID=2650611 RepID=UPI0018C50E5A|nr:hypothetical protein [Nostoc sp. WHI]MBG1270264.1 hypothetical protein [Nostoc sp. WHI]